MIGYPWESYYTLGLDIEEHQQQERAERLKVMRESTCRDCAHCHIPRMHLFPAEVYPEAALLGWCDVIGDFVGQDDPVYIDECEDDFEYARRETWQ